MHTLTSFFMDCCISEMVWSSCRWSDRHPQCDGELSLHCQQELHTQRFLGLKSEDRGGPAVGPPLPIPRS
jgi:hypothetical protein